MTRTDTHRPSFLDPAEYTEVGYFDLHPEDGGGSIDEGYSDKDSFMGNFASRGRCDHCGAGPLRYIVIFHHAPTDTLVTVGTRCAGVLGLTSRTERERRQAIEQARREKAVADWRASDERYEAVYQWLNEKVIEKGQYGRGGFFFDLLHKCNRYGNLSDAQVAAVEKNIEREAGFKAQAEARTAGASAVEEGRREITGTIVSTKLVEGFGGDDVLKMLVEESDGNRVFGTVPSYLVEMAEGSYDGTREPVELKGLKITFKAQVERSQKDEHFGFFKRPTSTHVVEEVAS